MKKMGGTARLFSLEQSDENGFTGFVFGYKYFELSLEHLLFLSLASLLLSCGMQNVSKFILFAEEVPSMPIARLCKCVLLLSFLTITLVA